MDSVNNKLGTFFRMGVWCNQNYCFFRMDYHTIELRKACRVCGKRVNKAKERERSYLVCEYRSELAEAFGIDTSSDCKDTHPLSFRHSCRVFMRSWQKRGTNAQAVGRVFSRSKHTELNCKVREYIYLKNCSRHTTISDRSVSTSVFSK